MAFWTTLARKVSGARNYSVAELALVPVNLLLLAAARLAIAVLPLGRVVEATGRQVPARDASPLRHTTSTQDRRARSIGRSLRATAALVPWRSDCLPQALAAAFMLKMAGIPYRLTIGVEPGESDTLARPMQAHAWIATDRRVVTGGPVADALRPVVSLVHPRSSP